MAALLTITVGSQGIGRANGRALVDSDARVVIGDREATAVAELGASAVAGRDGG